MYGNNIFRKWSKQSYTPGMTDLRHVPRESLGMFVADGDFIVTLFPLSTQMQPQNLSEHSTLLSHTFSRHISTEFAIPATNFRFIILGNMK